MVFLAVLAGLMKISPLTAARDSLEALRNPEHHGVGVATGDRLLRDQVENLGTVPSLVRITIPVRSVNGSAHRETRPNPAPASSTGTTGFFSLRLACSEQ
jgi:hypothetical protein